MKTETPEPHQRPPSHETNKSVVRAAWAAYDRGDAEAFAACLADGWREHDWRGGGTTIDDERQAMSIHRVAFPDKHTEVLLAIAEDDWVCARTLTTATHLGRYFDLEPTGRQVRLNEISLHRIEGGRIAETWALIDGPGFYEQISGRPAPEQTDNMA